MEKWREHFQDVLQFDATQDSLLRSEHGKQVYQEEEYKDIIIIEWYSSS